MSAWVFIHVINYRPPFSVHSFTIIVYLIHNLSNLHKKGRKKTSVFLAMSVLELPSESGARSNITDNFFYKSFIQTSSPIFLIDMDSSDF